MLIQSISDYFFTEYLLVGYFIILILGFELTSFFIFQLVTRRGRSPRWILAFSVTIIALTMVYLLRALNDLIFNNEPSATEIIYQIDLIIVSVCSIASSYLMIDFFKRRGTISSILSKACLILGIISTIIDILAVAANWGLQISFAAVAGMLSLVIILFPVYIMIQLAKREDSGLKKLFWLAVTGEFIIFIGMVLNFKLFDDVIKTLVPSSYGTFKIVILLIIIAGLSMIGLSFFYLPPVDDFLWVDDLLALYVLAKSTQVILFKKIFNPKAIAALPFANKDIDTSVGTEDMFLGGIGGISDMLSETLTDSGKKVELIDQGTVKLLLSHEGDLIFILIAKQNPPILNWKLKKFKESFMLFYGDLVKRFTSNPEKFLPVEKLVARIFKNVPNIEKKS